MRINNLGPGAAGPNEKGTFPDALSNSRRHALEEAACGVRIPARVSRKPLFEFHAPTPRASNEHDGGLPECVEKGGCLVIRGDLEVEEAARDALGQTFVEPMTNVLTIGFRLLEGNGGDSVTAEELNEICGLAKKVVDPEKFVSSMVDQGVRHLVSALLVPSFGPVGVGIAFFFGKFAGELTDQVLKPESDSHGGVVRVAENIIDSADMLGDASVGRLAESDSFREYIGKLLDKPIIAILPGDTHVVPSPSAGETAAQPASIRVLLMAFKVDCPTGGSLDDRQEQPSLQHGRKRDKVEAERAPQNTVAASGDSRAARARPAFARLVCVPKDAIAARGTWTSYHQAPFEQENLLLTDGTLIERHIHAGAPGRWARVSDLPATTDQQEAKEFFKQRRHELTSQFKGASRSTPTSVDADLLAAYRALKEWAIRNRVQ